MSDQRDYLINERVRRLLGPRRDEDFQTYSGSDIQAVMYLPLVTKERALGSKASPKFKVFAELETISISSTRSASPVRVLGRKNPLVFTRGCIKHTELIHTARGLVPISDLDRGDLILSEDEATGELELHKCSDIVDTGTKPCFHVTLEDGSVMSLTADHRVKTRTDWKKVHELTSEDELLVSARDLKVEVDLDLQGASLDLLAFTLASQATGAPEDSLHLEIPAGRFRVVSNLVKVLDLFGMDYSISQAGKVRIHSEDPKIPAFLSSLDPSYLNQASNWQLSRVLSIVWGVLGSSSKSQMKTGLRLSYERRDVARTFKTWLSRLGVHSTLHSGALHIEGKYRLQFLRSVGPDVLVPQLKKLLVALAEEEEYDASELNLFMRKYNCWVQNPFSYVVPGKTAIRFIPEEFRDRFYHEASVSRPPPQSVWCKVQDIEFDGTHQTYDIEVEENHNLFGSFLSHNSRTYAGTMVFASINKDVFSDVYETEINDNAVEDPSLLFVDQMPPFSVVLTLSNEKGGVAMRIINGIHILNYGTTYSIDDVYTQDVYTFVATSVTPQVTVASKRIGQHDVNIYRPPVMRSVLDFIEEVLHKSYGAESSLAGYNNSELPQDIARYL